MPTVPLFVYLGNGNVGGVACWSLLSLCCALGLEEAHSGLGSGPDAVKNRRGSLTPLGKMVMPLDSDPGAAWVWGFLVVPGDLATSELGLEVKLALLFPGAPAP